MNKVCPFVLVALLALPVCNLNAQSSLIKNEDPAEKPDTTLFTTKATTDESETLNMLNWMLFKFETAHFDTASYRLSRAAKKVLTRKADWLKTQDVSVKITIIGHCDQRGSTTFNKQLGARRASAAKNYLINHGVSPKQINITSAGDQQPVAYGQNEKAWFKNRRVEVK